MNETSINMIPEMLRIKDVQERVPALSYEFLRQLCVKNKVVHISTGRKYLINWNDLCRYLNTGDGNGGAT